MSISCSTAETMKSHHAYRGRYGCHVQYAGGQRQVVEGAAMRKQPKAIRIWPRRRGKGDEAMTWNRRKAKRKLPAAGAAAGKQQQYRSQKRNTAAAKVGKDWQQQYARKRLSRHKKIQPATCLRIQPRISKQGGLQAATPRIAAAAQRSCLLHGQEVFEARAR